MKSFRTPRYLERYEDVVFDLENRLEINPNDTQHQNRDGLKIVADNSGETTPFDWYNARLSVNFKVDKLAGHANIPLNDNIGTVNGSNSLIKKIQVRAEGREVYDCDYANHCVNIKNLNIILLMQKVLEQMSIISLIHQDMLTQINTQKDK